MSSAMMHASGRQQKRIVPRFISDFAAGGAAGAVSTTMESPLSHVKVIITLSTADPRFTWKGGHVKPYASLFDCAKRVVLEEGIGRLFRGNMYNCMFAMPVSATNLAAKDAFKRILQPLQAHDVTANFAAGALAGAASTLVLHPLERIYQLNGRSGRSPASFRSVWDCMAGTSVRSLYRGVGIAVAGAIPHRGVLYGLNDTLKTINPWDGETAIRGLASKLLCAKFACFVSEIVSSPFDLVRHRLIMDSGRALGQREFSGALDCARKMLATESIRVMLRYVGPFVLWRRMVTAWELLLYGEMTADGCTLLGFHGTD